MNYNVKAKRVSLFGFYMVGSANADTSGATYFPSDQFDPRADYGRANFDVRNRFLLGEPAGSLRHLVQPHDGGELGSPFNITIGQDLNGDNQFNDRPAFATSTSTNVMQTRYGTFDLDPSANEARIPYNYGTGPGQFSMNMRVSKSFGIGPKVDGLGSEWRTWRAWRRSAAGRRSWWRGPSGRRPWTRRPEPQRWSAAVRPGLGAALLTDFRCDVTERPEQGESGTTGLRA